MRANRIIFRKLKQQYDLLQMKSAYILGEMELQHDENFEDRPHFMIAQEEIIETPKPKTKRQALKYQIRALEDLRVELLDQEKYEEVIEADELLIKLKRELNGI